MSCFSLYRFIVFFCFFLFFLFNDTATTEIYTYLHTLSLHDALPIFHLFHTTFNIYRVSAKLVLKPDTDGLSSVFFAAKGDENEALDAYKAQNIRTFADGFRLEDDSVQIGRAHV